jgi:hypothetical protein
MANSIAAAPLLSDLIVCTSIMVMILAVSMICFAGDIKIALSNRFDCHPSGLISPSTLKITNAIIGLFRHGEAEKISGIFECECGILFVYCR